jgi:hypothetical protein
MGLQQNQRLRMLKARLFLPTRPDSLRRSAHRPETAEYSIVPSTDAYQSQGEQSNKAHKIKVAGDAASVKEKEKKSSYRYLPRVSGGKPPAS